MLSQLQLDAVFKKKIKPNNIESFEKIVEKAPLIEEKLEENLIEFKKIELIEIPILIEEKPLVLEKKIIELKPIIVKEKPKIEQKIEPEIEELLDFSKLSTSEKSHIFAINGNITYDFDGKRGSIDTKYVIFSKNCSDLFFNSLDRISKTRAKFLLDVKRVIINPISKNLDKIVKDNSTVLGEKLISYYKQQNTLEGKLRFISVNTANILKSMDRNFKEFKKDENTFSKALLLDAMEQSNPKKYLHTLSSLNSIDKNIYNSIAIALKNLNSKF